MTAQLRESLLYNGNHYRMASVPLRPYLELHNVKFISTCTACWRGYTASWEIDDDKLYLVDMNANLPSEKEGVYAEYVGMDYLFPGQDRVLADWFSGEIRIPHGELLEYIHMGYQSVYEKELFLEFKEGRLVGRREVINDRNEAKNCRDKFMGLFDKFFEDVLESDEDCDDDKDDDKM